MWLLRSLVHRERVSRVPHDNGSLTNIESACRRVSCGPGLSSPLTLQQFVDRRAARLASAPGVVAGRWRPQRARKQPQTQTIRRPAVDTVRRSVRARAYSANSAANAPSPPEML